MKPIDLRSDTVTLPGEAMRATMAPLLGVGEDAVSIKATTNEKMGFVGRLEGVCAHAVALVQRTA